MACQIATAFRRTSEVAPHQTKGSQAQNAEGARKLLPRIEKLTGGQTMRQGIKNRHEFHGSSKLIARTIQIAQEQSGRDPFRRRARSPSGPRRACAPPAPTRTTPSRPQPSPSRGSCGRGSTEAARPPRRRPPRSRAPRPPPRRPRRRRRARRPAPRRAA